MNRPLNGLVHIQSFSEDIEFEKFYDEENEKWHILFQIWRTDQIKKKMISGKLELSMDYQQRDPRTENGRSLCSPVLVNVERFQTTRGRNGCGMTGHVQLKSENFEFKKNSVRFHNRSKPTKINLRFQPSKTKCSNIK